MVTGLTLALRPLGTGVWPENWFNGADKLLHLAFFTLLWCCGDRARLTPAWLLGLGLLLFGVGIELAQGFFTTTRDASSADVLADGAGLLLGAVLTRWASWRQPQEDRG